MGGAGCELVDGAHEQVFSGVEQPVVNVSGGVVGSNGHFDAAEHVAGVDFVLEEKGAGARGGFAIQNRPMDRGRSAVLGQKRPMQVDRAQTRTVPHHFRQHAERHHHTEVGVPLVQQRVEFRGFQFLRLGEGKVVRQSDLLHFRGPQRAPTTRLPVWCSDHANHLVLGLEQLLKACGRELGCAQEKDAQGLRTRLRRTHGAKVTQWSPRSTTGGLAATAGTTAPRKLLQSCRGNRPNPPSR